VHIVRSVHCEFNLDIIQCMCLTVAVIGQLLKHYNLAIHAVKDIVSPFKVHIFACFVLKFCKNTIRYVNKVTQHIPNYWVFGLCPLSGILKTRKHNVSETGSVSEMLCFLVFIIPDY
jgi:hypothetical protein